MKSTYDPVELAIEGARAKVENDYERYYNIRPIIIDNRILIEAELKRKSKGRQPPPHIVIDKLLKTHTK